MSDYQTSSEAGRGTVGRALMARDIAYVLYRRRFVILGVALPILLVASLGLFKNTASYVASCKVLLELQAPEVPRWNTKAYVDYDRSLSTYQHMAVSLPVARQAAESLQDSLQVILSLDDGRYRKLADKDELTEFLLNNLNADPVGESRILELRFGSPNNRLSLMALRAIRDAFMDYTVEATKNTKALEYYNERVAAVRNEIDSLLALRSRITREAGFFYLEEDLKHITALQTELKDELNKAETQRRELESQVRAMRLAQKADSLYVPIPDRKREASPMLNAKERVDLLMSKLTDLRSRYTDDNLEVKRLNQRLQGEIASLRREVENYIQGIEIEAEVARQKERSIRQQIQQMQRQLDLAPEVDRRASLIDNEVVAKQMLLKELQVKQGEVELNEHADERVNAVVKLTDPEIKQVISGSRKIIYFLLISFLGLVFGIIVAFIADAQDHRVYSPDRLEEQLGTPVLGAITDAEKGGA